MPGISSYETSGSQIAAYNRKPVSIEFIGPTEGAARAFWQAIDASGIPHTTEPPEDFGTTVITTTWDQVPGIEAIAAAHGGFVGKWA